MSADDKTDYGNQCYLCKAEKSGIRLDAETGIQYSVCQRHFKCQYQEFKAAILSTAKDITVGIPDPESKMECEACGREATGFFVSNNGTHYGYCSRHEPQVCLSMHVSNNSGREAITVQYEPLTGLDDSQLLAMYEDALDMQLLAGKLTDHYEDLLTASLRGAFGSIVGNGELIIDTIKQEIRNRYDGFGNDIDPIHLLMCIDQWRRWRDGEDEEPSQGNPIYHDIKKRVGGFENVVNT